jgi:hypothetical protein
MRVGGGGAVGARGAGLPTPGAGCRFDEKSGMFGFRPFFFMAAPPTRCDARRSADSSQIVGPLVMRKIVRVATSTR